MRKKLGLPRLRMLVILLRLVGCCVLGSKLASLLLSNLSAFALPDSWRIGAHREQDDTRKSIRAAALTIDPNNWSAQVQDFRWLLATGDLQSAARWIPAVDHSHLFSQPDTHWFYEGYAWAKAFHLTGLGQRDRAIEYYHLALSRTSSIPDPNRVAAFYRTFAESLVSGGSRLEPSVRLRAGKLFLLAGERQLAFDQAAQIVAEISETGVQRQSASSWAYYVLGRAAYQMGDDVKALDLLESAIEADQNPQAAWLMAELAARQGDSSAETAAKRHLAGLAPDWAVTTEVGDSMCSWHLVGIDLDVEVLETGLQVVADLYWLPRGDRAANAWGLLDAGEYWIQPEYSALNGFIDAGFEWDLPDGETTFRAHPSECCDVVSTSAPSGRALRIRLTDLPMTSAVEQLVPRQLPCSYRYVVGGRVRWDEQTEAQSAQALLGGWWLDEAGETIHGVYSVGNGDLQELHHWPLSEPSANRHDGRWQQGAKLIEAPIEAVSFSPWIGLSTSWRKPPEGMRAGGTVGVLFDTLFLFPVFPPDGCTSCANYTDQMRTER